MRPELSSEPPSSPRKQEVTVKAPTEEKEPAPDKLLSQDESPAPEELFKFIFKYSEYVVRFVSMME